MTRTIYGDSSILSSNFIRLRLKEAAKIAAAVFFRLSSFFFSCGEKRYTVAQQQKHVHVQLTFTLILLLLLE